MFLNFKYCLLSYVSFFVGLQVINDILPVKARKEVDRLIAELQDGQFRLEFTPTTTLEFVNSLTFLEEIQERVGIFIIVYI